MPWLCGPLGFAACLGVPCGPLASVLRRAGRWAWQKVLALTGCRGPLGRLSGSGGGDPSVPPTLPQGSCPGTRKARCRFGEEGVLSASGQFLSGGSVGGDLGGLGWCPHCFPSAPSPPPRSLFAPRCLFLCFVRHCVRKSVVDAHPSCCEWPVSPGASRWGCVC